ncbi:hypothetical protein P3S67_028474 [Capsicum chacoense]
MEINSENNEVMNEVVIVIVPFQAQGHLNQLLQFACLISSYGLSVYYVSLASYNHQVRVRANALNPSYISKIHFNDLPSEFRMILHEPIASFVCDISSKSIRVVVHDYLMSYNVQVVSSLPNAESYMFNCISAFTTCSLKMLDIQLEEELLKKLPSLEGILSDEFREFSDSQLPYIDIRLGDIHNTSKVIKDKYLNMIAHAEFILNKKQWAIAPILPTKLHHRNNICFEWLNKQPSSLVLYISFEKTTSFSDRQIKELAMGLEQSRQMFIWVLREIDDGDRRLELPEEFKEREKNVGLVVREWAPQPEILAHSSTGGFMSHYGWNSCIESITMGVPIVAWPIHSDQSMNVFLVMEMLKIGLITREWEKRKELVSASTIENAMRKLMASEEGDTIRRRADEMGEALRRSAEKEGSSRKELDSFIGHITR